MKGSEGQRKTERERERDRDRERQREEMILNKQNWLQFQSESFIFLISNLLLHKSNHTFQYPLES